MKLSRWIPAAIALILLFSGCGDGDSNKTSVAVTTYPPHEALIRQFWDAFNHYDIEKCMTVFDPAYIPEKRPRVEADLKHFEQGRMLRVKLLVDSVTPVTTLIDGTLEARIVLKIWPRGLSDDRYLIYNFVHPDGVWMISRVYDDPEKTPPGSVPENLKAESVTPTQVKLTWENKSSRATGVRLERATDFFFKNDNIKIDLPKDTELYIDTDIKPGSTYYYRLYAFNIAGASDPSRRLEVEIPLS